MLCACTSLCRWNFFYNPQVSEFKRFPFSIRLFRLKERHCGPLHLVLKPIMETIFQSIYFKTHVSSEHVLVWVTIAAITSNHKLLSRLQRIHISQTRGFARLNEFMFDKKDVMWCPNASVALWILNTVRVSSSTATYKKYWIWAPLLGLAHPWIR